VYFRLTTKQELLGEERERINLQNIRKIAMVREDEIPITAIESLNEYLYMEITLIQPQNRTLLMRASKRDVDACQSWVTAIEEQRRFASFEVRDSIDSIASVSSAHSDQSSYSLADLQDTEPVSPLHVRMVGMVNADRVEHLVGKNVQYGAKLDLGIVKQGGACLILLEDGGLARIGTQALMGSWDANETCWVECLGAKVQTEVEVSVACEMINISNSQSASRPRAISVASPSQVTYWMEVAEEGASIGFLIMAMLVHIMYGVQGFHWSHKCCLTIGAALAIMTLLNGSSRSDFFLLFYSKVFHYQSYHS